MNPIQRKLTELYIKGMGGSPEGVRNFRLRNLGSIEVMVFHKNEPLFAGQTPLFLNSIIAEKSLFKQSNDIKNYILTHEYMHKRRFLTCTLLGIITLISGLFTVTSLMLSILSAILTILLFRPYTLYFIVGLLGMLIGLFFFSSSSWLIEILADYDTINVIGRNKFLKIMKERKRLGKVRSGKLTHKIINRLTHPPDSFILKLYDFIKG